jgi:hypothetical protein
MKKCENYDAIIMDQWPTIGGTENNEDWGVLVTRSRQYSEFSKILVKQNRF